ncbi:heme ABC transporter substrate-binding protein IsdE [Caldisalinibacter kiritimatiensis]|uniref:High-affinity heme uptake system protein IsdE n=1 Tax=Caldisalinibacter kiritimatiensis TaxID=1304284 RepID=R1ASK5_9FIRM|nr:heme ABC transporter substrate-binding protein IsdE [Caldisalinibacter kiritimatiensis]EOD00138.1 Periplasmic binding protein [Caldisalinibacter kiritimatiensis]
MKKKLALFLCLTLVLVGVVGCSASQVSGKIENKENQETSKNYPERTVAGTVAVVEMLDLLDVEMVGVPNSRYKLPESCNKAKRIGKPMTPDIEIIKSLNPDIFVSVSSLQPRLEKELKDSKIKSLFITNNSYDDMLDSIKILGDTFGKQKEAKEFIDEVNFKVEGILKETKDMQKPKVMILFGTPKSIMLATDKSFVGSLVNELGGINTTQLMGSFKEAYVPISMENALKTQPDIILRLTHASPEDSKKMFEKEFSNNPIWMNFKAVKNGNVYDLDNNYFGVSGNIRLVGAIERLGKILYQLDQ